MRLWRVIALALGFFGVLGFSVSAEADVLCFNSSGSVFVRTQCHSSETQFNPATGGGAAPQLVYEADENGVPLNGATLNALAGAIQQGRTIRLVVAGPVTGNCPASLDVCDSSLSSFELSRVELVTDSQGQPLVVGSSAPVKIVRSANWGDSTTYATGPDPLTMVASTRGTFGFLFNNGSPGIALGGKAHMLWYAQ